MQTITPNSSTQLFANLVAIVITWIYNIITTTKNKSPMFIISLHIFVTNIAFTSSTDVNRTAIIVYLTLLGFGCLLWEFGYALFGTYKENVPWYSEWLFALCETLTGFFNLCALALFSTQGVPLNYLVSLSQDALTVVAVSVIIINYVIDLLEQKYWSANWKKMYNNMTANENKVLTVLNAVSNNPILPSANVLTTDITNVINNDSNI
jgi:hypothetical protein